jgi:hypothetical protein
VSPAGGRERAGARARGGRRPLGQVLGDGDLGQSLLYAFPLLLLYAVGIVVAPRGGNGVDFISRGLYAALGYSTRNYLICYGVMTLAFAGAVIWLRKAGGFSGKRFSLMVLESAVVALCLGTFINFVMQKVLGMGVGEGRGVIGNIVASAGAGVHEELIFRLGAFAGGGALLKLLGLGHKSSMIIAGVVSSLAFSAVHHLGAAGDPWQLDTFVFRALAGGAFATIFYFRSFAHAVWTHALYDMYVMIVRGR